jgi:thiol-disulfide isomerase/thioredoxin
MFSCSKPSLNIKGKISNVKDANLFFWVFENGDFIKKKEIKVKDGNFSFSYEIGDSEVGYMTSVDKFKYGKVIFMEDRTLDVEGLIFRDLFRVKKLKGEGLNSQFFAFEQNRIKLMKGANKGESYAEENELKEKFIANNASNILGLYELFELSKNPDNFLKVNKLFNKLPKSSKSYNLYSDIEDNLTALKSITSGNRAVDFNFTTLEGEKINLDYFKGKVLMIDFWASWCGPCCKELPHVKELHEKYHKQGFEVLGISMDSKKDKWLAAIEKFKLKWHNYSELKKWDNAFAKKYFVRGIPYNVLIDQNGNIVAKGIHGKKLDETVEKLLNN